jgi:hypothetical protein
MLHSSEMSSDTRPAWLQRKLMASSFILLLLLFLFLLSKNNIDYETEAMLDNYELDFNFCYGLLLDSLWFLSNVIQCKRRPTARLAANRSVVKVMVGRWLYCSCFSYYFDWVRWWWWAIFVFPSYKYFFGGFDGRRCCDGCLCVHPLWRSCWSFESNETTVY